MSRLKLSCAEVVVESFGEGEADSGSWPPDELQATNSNSWKKPSFNEKTWWPTIGPKQEAGVIGEIGLAEETSRKTAGNIGETLASKAGLTFAVPLILPQPAASVQFESVD